MRDNKKRAVSPVIATVILVAVAITIAVAVSYWMGGISSQYTRFEKVEVISAYCESTTAQWTDSGGSQAAFSCWKITLDLRNTGTTEAAIIGAFVNAKGIADYGYYNDTILAKEFLDDHIRAYATDEAVATNQLNFAEITGHSTCEIKLVVVPGDSGKIIVEIKQEVDPDTLDYSFSSGTTVEVALLTGAGNTYMKMVTLS